MWIGHDGGRDYGFSGDNILSNFPKRKWCEF